MVEKHAEAGFASARMNPLRAAERAKDLTSNTFDACRKAAQEGRIVAWGGGPTEILEPMDIPYIRFGYYAASARRAGVAPLLCEVAEAEGFSQEICSYLRIWFGAALLMKRGDMDLVPEALRLPRPHFILPGTDCYNQNQWVQVLGELLDVPVFLLDQPFMYQADHWKRDNQYAAGQLRDLASFLEELTGHPYDWQGLRRLVASYRKANQLRMAIKEANKEVPALADIIDGQLCGTVVDARLDPETIVKFYEEVNAELDKRRESGIAAVSPERCRLLWYGMPFRGEERNLHRMFGERGAVAVTGFASDKAFGEANRHQLPPDGIDVDRPLLTIAAYGSRLCNTLDWQIREEVYDNSQGYSIDGAVLFSSRTCRPCALGIYDIRDEIIHVLGIPAVVLEGDHSDPRVYSTMELERGAQALVEMIMARKSKAR